MLYFYAAYEMLVSYLLSCPAYLKLEVKPQKEGVNIDISLECRIARFSWYKIPKRGKIYQMTTKYTK
jgi:hypothetical protein